MAHDITLGQFLKQLREGKGLSLRQAAEKAGLSSGYLSQVEGEKRGRRKTGEFFAPHPQILQKLAAVYHVPAAQLLERAGYLEAREHYFGFPEEKEIDRLFEFVIHDPLLKEALSSMEKKAIVQRYETVTGRKLITWAGNDSALSKKASFTGIRLEDGMLQADSVQQTLSADELAHELGISPDELKTLVRHGHLRSRPNSQEFGKQDILNFKNYCLKSGLHLMQARDRKAMPQTESEWVKAEGEVQEEFAKPARERIKKSRVGGKKEGSEGAKP